MKASDLTHLGAIKRLCISAPLLKWQYFIHSSLQPTMVLQHLVSLFIYLTMQFLFYICLKHFMHLEAICTLLEDYSADPPHFVESDEKRLSEERYHCAIPIPQ
jgi:hypothetical protein